MRNIVVDWRQEFRGEMAGGVSQISLTDRSLVSLESATNNSTSSYKQALAAEAISVKLRRCCLWCLCLAMNGRPSAIAPFLTGEKVQGCAER